jgi:glutamine amidotransferase
MTIEPMCRLFGFRSVINSQVHSSLVHAENAFVSQSVKHSDGWGVAYYRENVPHLIKSTDRAVDDHIFHKVSGIVSSQTVLAHLRKATHGNLTILNSHPFQYGKWIFAHNGNLKLFTSYRDDLLNKIDPDLRRFVLGTTDSEIFFYLMLTQIKKRHSLADPVISVDLLREAIEETCIIITNFSGPLYGKEDGDPTQNHLTFILTTGQVMVGLHGGQKLNFSTYKKSCSEKDVCAHYSVVCENKVVTESHINHLIFSSEVLEGENVWEGMQHGDLIGVDADMKFKTLKINVPFTN